MNIKLIHLILKTNKVINYTLLYLYVFNLLLIYLTVLFISIISLIKAYNPNFLTYFFESIQLLFFNPVYCMDSLETSSLQSLFHESIRIENIPLKFQTTVDSLIKYESFKDMDQKICIKKYDYIHAIINDIDCELSDLKNVLTSNQIIELIKGNKFHNEEMSPELVLSIRKEYSSDLFIEETSEIDNFVRTQISYKSKLALQDLESELTNKYRV